MIARETCRCQQLIGPVAFCHIKPKRTGTVRHVPGIFACQLEPDIVLGQQHLCGLGKDVRLILTHPLELGCGKSGHHPVASKREEPGLGSFKVRALFCRPAVVPQNAGTQRLAVGIQKRCPMHVSRETDAANGGHLSRRFCGNPVHGCLACRPPAVRILLRPGGMRTLNGEICCR